MQENWVETLKALNDEHTFMLCLIIYIMNISGVKNDHNTIQMPYLGVFLRQFYLSGESMDDD